MVDMFLMLANLNPTQKTAYEIAERHEEKLLMLGPTLGRIEAELLEPTVKLTFQTALEAGILPPLPDELQGIPLQIEFISALAQAQKAVGMQSMDRLVTNVLAVSDKNPDVMDKVDWDFWIDEQADILGTAPQLVIETSEALQVREARNALAAQQAQADALEQGAATAEKLASAQTSEPSALTEVVQ